MLKFYLILTPFGLICSKIYIKFHLFHLHTFCIIVCVKKLLLFDFYLGRKVWAENHATPRASEIKTKKSERVKTEKSDVKYKVLNLNMYYLVRKCAQNRDKDESGTFKCIFFYQKWYKLTVQLVPFKTSYFEAENDQIGVWKCSESIFWA